MNLQICTNQEKAKLFAMYVGAPLQINETHCEELTWDKITGIDQGEYPGSLLILTPIENITQEHFLELWSVIGGAPHLYEYGKEDLKKGLLEGDWDDSGLQMDYLTMAKVLQKCRELGYDCDECIELGIAKTK